MSRVVTQQATKMRKLKSTIFTICLVLSITQFSLGDDVLEMIRVIEERFNAFEESEHQKDERIAALETTNTELVTEVQNLGMKLKKALMNLTELDEYTNLVNVHQSCGALALLGLSKSRQLLVDYDHHFPNHQWQ